MTELAQGPKTGRRASGGMVRFWLPFAAIVLAFAGIAVAYASSESVREPASGAVRRAPTGEEAARHGLEPEAEPAQ